MHVVFWYSYILLSSVLYHTEPTQRRRNMKTRQPPIILDLCLRKIRAGKVTPSPSKSTVSKCFPSTYKHKAVVFKFLWFEARFPKAPFLLRRTIVDGRPNRRNKVAFSIFCSVVCGRLWRLSLTKLRVTESTWGNLNLFYFFKSTLSLKTSVNFI